MSYLKDKRCYLSGAIEHSVGANWRTKPKEILINRFGLNIFDPFDDPKQNRASELYAAKEAGNWDLVEEIASAFVSKDLGLVGRSDLLIAHLPYKVSTCGSHHEIVNACNSKLPVLLICPEGSQHIPLWYRGFIKRDHMFGSWEEIYEFLDQVEKGSQMSKKRWRFIYGLL